MAGLVKLWRCIDWVGQGPLRAESRHSPQARNIHAKSEEADIHPIVAEEPSLHGRKSAQSPLWTHRTPRSRMEVTCYAFGL